MPSMPDEMTDEQSNKAKAWIMKMWKGSHACPVCLNDNWLIANNLIGVSILSPTGGINLGPTYPQCAVICRDCGHTVLFNAVIMGLLPYQSDDKGEKP